MFPLKQNISHASHRHATDEIMSLATVSITKIPSVSSDTPISERENQMTLSKAIDAFRLVVAEGTVFVIYRDDAVSYHGFAKMAAGVVTLNTSYSDAGPTNNARLLLTGNTSWIPHSNPYILDVLMNLYENDTPEFARVIEDVEDQYEVIYHELYQTE